MPRPQSGAVHETPHLISQLSMESKPFLNDVQRQALDAALAAKLAKLSGETFWQVPASILACGIDASELVAHVAATRGVLSVVSSAAATATDGANGGPRPASATRTRSGEPLRTTKSEVLQDRKSRTGKSSMRTSKKNGAGACYVVEDN